MVGEVSYEVKDITDFHKSSKILKIIYTYINNKYSEKFVFNSDSINEIYNFLQKKYKKSSIITYITRLSNLGYLIETERKRIRRKTKYKDFKFSPGTKEYRKEAYLKRQYSITGKDLEILKTNSNNTCSICERKNDNLVIDHDHNTGKVRGLLCVRCNTGLGKFKDDVELLTKAINYLNNSTK